MKKEDKSAGATVEPPLTLPNLDSRPPPPLTPTPSGLSLEVERLATDPSTRIAAIKLYQEQNPGVSVSEAEAKIEEFLWSRK